MTESHIRYKTQLKYNVAQEPPVVREAGGSESKEPFEKQQAAAAPTSETVNTNNEVKEDENKEEEEEEDSKVNNNAVSEKTGQVNDESNPDNYDFTADPHAALRRAANLNDSVSVGCLPGVAPKPAKIIMTSIDVKKATIAKPVEKQLMRIIAEDDRGIPHLLVNDPGPYPKNIYNIGFFKNLW